MRVLNCGTNNTTHHPDLQQNREDMNTLLMVWTVPIEASSGGVELVMLWFLTPVLLLCSQLAGPPPWATWVSETVLEQNGDKAAHLLEDRLATQIQTTVGKIIFRFLPCAPISLNVPVFSIIATLNWHLYSLSSVAAFPPGVYIIVHVLNEEIKE